MNALVIGSGFAGLSAACYLAKSGFNVTVFEKNSTLGGRARSFKEQGFTFDMGPSWYWMPDVFDRFFADFDKQVSDYYRLVRLDPSYKVFWKDDSDEIPASMSELEAFFEKYEKGSAIRLKEFLKEAKQKYDIGMGDFVVKPSLSVFEFISVDIAKKGWNLNLFQSISKQIRSLFHHPKLIELLEFPVLFLGAKPENTPSLYSLMNYADLALGTWYPMGGMNEIVKAMVSLAKELGVTFHTDSAVQAIKTNGDICEGVVVNNKLYSGDIVVSGADYHFTEKLLSHKERNYSENYWDRRTMAPSSLLYYLGVDKQVEGLLHHNLFFDEDFGVHATEIYDTHSWPEKPLFYVCCPSKTDDNVAPEGKENIFILIPVSTEIEDNSEIRETYYNLVCDRIKEKLGMDLREHVVFRRDFARSHFIEEYNSFKGNAYGLANTLRQTAILKPKCKNKKLNNLYYTGQLTVPGPGVPPSIISGKIVSNLICKEHRHEIVI